MRFFALLLGALFLVACGSETETTVEDKPIEDVTTNPDQLIDNDYVPEDPIVTEFELKDMPSEWLLLSKDGDVGFIINDYWDCQEQALYFFGDDENGWMMDIGMCQDTEQGDISNFSAELTNGEGIHVVNGSFDYAGNLEVEPRTIEFEWNQMTRQGHFAGVNMGTEYFVPRKDSDWYETIAYEREED